MTAFLTVLHRSPPFDFDVGVFYISRFRMASTLGPSSRLNTAPATIIRVQTPTTAAQLTPPLGAQNGFPLGLVGELGLDPADPLSGAAAVEIFGEHTAQDHDGKAGDGSQLGQKQQGRNADGRSERALAHHQQFQQGGQVQQKGPPPKRRRPASRPCAVKRSTAARTAGPKNRWSSCGHTSASGEKSRTVGRARGGPDRWPTPRWGCRRWGSSALAVLDCQ